jgi:membrane-associated phospholipid phosphatase
MGWFYNHIRSDARLATTLNSTAQILAFSTAAAPLSYVAASIARPVWDTTLMNWDKDLGLNWQTLLAVMNDYPELHRIFAFAYSNIISQVTIVIVALMLADRTLWLRRFVIAFVTTTLISILISVVIPAQGVWGYLHLTSHDYPAISPVTQDQHLSIFNGLRDGTRRLLTGEGTEGIITFPSMHAALALLFIFALWSIPATRWLGMAFNIIMILSTPIDGGHYFSDVIAGMVMAILCWMAACRLVPSDAEEGDIAMANARSLSPVAALNMQESDALKLHVRENVT